MSYIQRKESLEEIAAKAISEGITFADHYDRLGPALTGLHRRSLPQTLLRLKAGDVLDERDDECIAAMGDALVQAANKLSSGYGNRILNVCTNDDVLFCKELEDLRWFILRWDSFRFVRRQLQARMMARRLLSDQSGD